MNYTLKKLSDIFDFDFIGDGNYIIDQVSSFENSTVFFVIIHIWVNKMLLCKLCCFLFEIRLKFLIFHWYFSLFLWYFCLIFPYKVLSALCLKMGKVVWDSCCLNNIVNQQPSRSSPPTATIIKIFLGHFRFWMWICTSTPWLITHPPLNRWPWTGQFVFYLPIFNFECHTYHCRITFISVIIQWSI